MNNVIPAMTHELSRYWEQPDRSEIEIDDTHALMTPETFEKLHEYSASQPTGAYEGKMWRAQMRDGTWRLRWFGESPDPGYVTRNQREIIVEGRGG